MSHPPEELCPINDYKEKRIVHPLLQLGIVRECDGPVPARKIRNEPAASAFVFLPALRAHSPRRSPRTSSLVARQYNPPLSPHRGRAWCDVLTGCMGFF